MRGIVVIAVVAFSSGGCGAAVSSARFTDAQPAPVASDVKLLSTKSPRCEYDEIGLVSATRRTGFTSLQDMLDAVRKRAQRMGGDAVVGVNLKNAPQAVVTSEGVTVNDGSGVVGTVIRFRDANCRE